jgi:hypothetical protein
MFQRKKSKFENNNNGTTHSNSGNNINNKSDGSSSSNNNNNNNNNNNINNSNHNLDVNTLIANLKSNELTDFDIKRAEKLFKDPNNVEHQFYLACLLVKSSDVNQIKRGIGIFQNLRKKNTIYKRESRYYMAYGYFQLGQVFEAKMQLLRMIKSSEPDHSQAKKLLQSVESKIQSTRSERKHNHSTSILIQSCTSVEPLAKTRSKIEDTKEEISTTPSLPSRILFGSSNRIEKPSFNIDLILKRIPADMLHLLIDSFNNFESGTSSRKNSNCSIVDRDQFCNAMGTLSSESTSPFFHHYLFRGIYMLEKSLKLSDFTSDVERIFNEGQEITLEAYICAMGILLYGTEEERAQFAFEMFDRDEKGYLELKDFEEAFKTIFDQYACMGLYNNSEPITESAIQAAKRVFTLLNIKPTQKITKSTFCELITKFRHIASTMFLFDDFKFKMADCVARGSPTVPGTSDWDYCVNVMVGLRYAQDMLTPLKRDLILEDFHLEVTFKVPNCRISNATSANSFNSPISNIFGNNITSDSNENNEDSSIFVDYAPRVFRKLREKDAISDVEYLYSMGPEQLIANMLFGKLTSFRVQGSEESGGRSGSSFLFSHDGKFIIKNVSGQEFANFKRVLPDYYAYLNANANSLITRIYGCFVYAGKGYIIMRNVFNTTKNIHEIYDLKGSKVARSNPNGPVYKDMDLTQKIVIGEQKRNMLISIIYRDINFLHDMGFTDYSLLLGIHYVDGYQGKKLQDIANTKGKRNAQSIDSSTADSLFHEESTETTATNHTSHANNSARTNKGEPQSASQLFPSDNTAAQLNRLTDKEAKKQVGNYAKSDTRKDTQALNAPLIRHKYYSAFPMQNTEPLFNVPDNGISSIDDKQIYYLGIIDTFTVFSVSKKVELNLKTIKYGVRKRKEISSQPPLQYSQRIKQYVDNLIK